MKLAEVLHAIWYPDVEVGMTVMWLQVAVTVALMCVLMGLHALGVKISPLWFHLVLVAYAVFTLVHGVVFVRYNCRE